MVHKYKIWHIVNNIPTLFNTHTRMRTHTHTYTHARTHTYTTHTNTHSLLDTFILSIIRSCTRSHIQKRELTYIYTHIIAQQTQMYKKKKRREKQTYLKHDSIGN